MSKFSEIFQGLVINSLEQAYQYIINIGPKILLSLFILLIGWICALLLKKVTSKLLKALGVDVLAEKMGMAAFLQKGGVKKRPSALAGLVLYWLIVFSALVMAFNTLGLEIASQFIQQALLYIPKLMAALILVAVGIFIGKFMGKFVGASAHLANIPYYSALDKAARYLIIGLAVMLALEYLGVTATIITQYGLIIFGIVPLVIFLILLVGGRDLISCALAGRLLRKIYAKDDIIELESVSGQISSIDFITTKIKTKDGELIVPHSEIISKVVKRSRKDQK